MGFFVDRWGARWILFAGGLFVGLGLIFLSSIGSFAGYFVGFLIISFGTGCTGPSVFVPAASNWFRRRLGLAMGVLAAGFAFGGLLLPVLVKVIDVFQWRQALFILGISGLVNCLPLSFLVRNKPEKYGCGPDGAPLSQVNYTEENTAVVSRHSTPELDVTVKQALRSRTFWQITLAFTLQYTVVSAMLAHIMPFLGSVGVDRSTAGFIAAAIPVISMAGRLGSGWLSDKSNRKLVAVASFAIVLVRVFLFGLVNSFVVGF